jgi:hypothetical protein
MSRINIRFAEESDQLRLIKFINDYWKKDHIFVKDPNVFSWQYRNKDGRWNIVLAENTYNNGEKSIIGILGFIPLGRYDENLGDDCIFLAVWKVREDVCPPGIGLQMLKKIKKTLSPSFIGAIGISDIVKPIYQALGYQTGKLDQLALLNPCFQGDYKIAKVPNKIYESNSICDSSVSLLELDVKDKKLLKKVNTLADSSSPTKSFSYIKNRYLEHPWYSYEVRCVLVNETLTAILVWRVVELDGRRVIRIVDIIGGRDWLDSSRLVFLEEMTSTEAEYVDIMASGVNVTALKKTGFVSAQDYENLVIPNYFSPYVEKNIEVYFACNSFSSSDICSAFFRADSDQDRPN